MRSYTGWTFWVPAFIAALVYMTIRQRFLGLVGLLVCFIAGNIGYWLIEHFFPAREKKESATTPTEQS